MSFVERSSLSRRVPLSEVPLYTVLRITSSHTCKRKGKRKKLTSVRELKIFLSAVQFQIQELERELLGVRSRLSDQRNERDREMDEVAQSLSLQVSNLQVNNHLLVC